MSLRIRALQLHVKTPAGPYGCYFEFSDGLVVLHAGNTMGKSTCVHSILYALGLEGMLSSKHDVPLPRAMTHVISDSDGQQHQVLESHVMLEIENHAGEVLTIQRPVRSSLNTRLVRTWSGPKLTNPAGVYEQSDRFVRVEGAAQRTDGFHYVLARFLGWALPPVTRYQGSPCPLYLECIFPLIVIEQKRGWGGIQARMPTHFGIREPERRAIEFLLDLDQYKIVMARQKLETQASEIRVEWTHLFNEYISVARRAGGVARDVVRTPTDKWPPATPPRILVPKDETLIALDVHVSQLRQVLQRLEREEIPRVEQVSVELREQLATAQEELAHGESAIERLTQELEGDRLQGQAVAERIAALNEDLRHNMDIIRLQQYGSTLGLATARQECPTCGQHLPDTLLPQRVESMAVDENIQLLREQVATFEALQKDTERLIAVREAMLSAAKERAEELRERVRVQKRALTADGRAPSEVAIHERLQTEQQVRNLQALLDESERVVAQLEMLVVRWRQVQEQLEQASSSTISSSDERKLHLLEVAFLEQLKEYRFESFPVEELKISRETYRPEHEGFDLGVDISASDMIRTIWAYLSGLLELRRQEETKHPGLLILDEPRQQSTSPVSFATFLRRASRAAQYGEQVIFATSEEKTVLVSALKNTRYSLIEVVGRVIKPV